MKPGGRYMNYKQLAAENYTRTPKWLLKLLATPRNLVVEPVAGCNVTCSACPQDQLRRLKGMMRLETFKAIIDKVEPTNVGLYFMGEPMLNPHIFDMIEYAHSKKARTVINTNGTTLHRDYKRISESSLNKLTVSIDGVSQEVFGAYRHGINAAQVLHGLKLLSMANHSGPHIQVRTLAFENTMKEIPQIKEAMALMNISDHRIIEPIVTGWGGKHNLDLDKLGYKGRVKDHHPGICPSLFRFAVTWDGNVLPCCNDVHGENVFGNILEDEYMKIAWGSDLWKTKALCGFKICYNCYED